MRFRAPHRREKRADRFDDLASAIDAGLSPLELLGATGGGTVEALAKQVDLGPVDRRILEAAEVAGELPAALRERAAAERTIATLQRGVVGRLVYPAFLIGCAIALAVFTSTIGLGPGPAVPVAIAATLVGVLLALYIGLRRAHERVEIPAVLAPIRPLLLDYGAIPYLAALRGLYRSGVPIVEAHDLASRTAPIGAVRARLMRAGSLLEHDRRSLTEALATQSAVDADTLTILTTAERAGDLEDGLGRALTRRSEVVSRHMQRLARAIGSICYVAALIVVAYVVVGFWTSLYGRI